MKREQDRFGRRAKKAGYPARSVYKLQDMDRRLGLFKPGLRVLDLGAAPGSWILYAAERVGARGVVIGVDLQPLRASLPANAKFIQADVFHLDPKRLVEEGVKFDAVISDMAPNTSGSRPKDQYLSYELFMRALQFARETLAPRGSFVGKIFQGPEFQQARDAIAAAFSRVRIVKPEASRKESYEIYIVGLDRL